MAHPNNQLIASQGERDYLLLLLTFGLFRRLRNEAFWRVSWSNLIKEFGGILVYV